MSYEYQPRPGTLACRALAWLQSFLADDPTGELSTSAWAGGMGVAGPDLISAMQAAVKAERVFCRQKGGHIRSPLFWSLVDHSIPKGLAGAARGPEAAEETTQAAEETTQAAEETTQAAGAHNAGGDDAKRDGGPASPGGFACGGPVPAGQLYTVGTGDREHFIPRPAVHTPVSARSEAAPAAQPTGTDEGVATPNDGRPACRIDLQLDLDAAREATRRWLRERTKPREVSAVQQVTLSFTVSLHLAERITQAVAKITEVRS